MSAHHQPGPCTCGLVACVCHDAKLREELRRYTARQLGAPTSSEDIVQTALVKGLFRQPPDKLAAIRNPRAYMYHVLRTVIADEHRKRTRRSLLESYGEGLEADSGDESFDEIIGSDRDIDPVELRIRLAEYRRTSGLSPKAVEALSAFLWHYCVFERTGLLPSLPPGTDVPKKSTEFDQVLVHTYLALHPDRCIPVPDDPGWVGRRRTHQSRFKKALLRDLEDFFRKPEQRP